MAEPKKRLTSSRSGNRQSHDALKPKSLSTCSNCKQSVMPHRVCQNCGFYRGEKVLSMKEEVKTKSKEQEEFKDE